MRHVRQREELVEESKQKIIDAMVAAGLTPPVVKDRMFTFRFPDCDKVEQPVLPFDNVSFAYDGKKEHYLYENLDFGVDCDSRIAPRRPQRRGEVDAAQAHDGRAHADEGRGHAPPRAPDRKYHQHSVDVLDKSKTVLDFFR